MQVGEQKSHKLSAHKSRRRELNRWTVVSAQKYRRDQINKWQFWAPEDPHKNGYKTPFELQESKRRKRDKEDLVKVHETIREGIIEWNVLSACESRGEQPYWAPKQLHTATNKWSLLSANEWKRKDMNKWNMLNTHESRRQEIIQMCLALKTEDRRKQKVNSLEP